MRREKTTGCLTAGLPGLAPDAWRRWVGRRSVWWPAGLPAARRVAFVSSRLGRRLENCDAWFAALRTVCMRLDPRDELLVAVRETAGHAFVERAAELFGVGLLRIVLPDETLTYDDWLQSRRGGSRSACEKMDVGQVRNLPWFRGSGRLQTCPTISSQSRNVARDESDGDFVAELSPPCDTGDSEACTAENIEPAARGAADWTSSGERSPLAAPLRDRVLLAFGQQVIAAHVRDGGQLLRLLHARLRDGAWPPGGVRVAIGERQLPAESQPPSESLQRLLADGAVGWYLYGDQPRRPAAPHRSMRAPVVALPDDVDWPLLAHCTRRRDGPWPNEPTSSWLDAWILADRPNDRSALAALERIVQQQRIIASSSANRGGHRVVCFTAAPLRKLGELRTFRPHRGRWDFESYAVCVRREWLESLGGRPVIYGDQATWESLEESQRPFFQKARSDGPRPIDWTVEREWRVVGDVDLSRLPVDAVLVVTPTRAEAERLATSSRWPVGHCQ